MRIICAVDKLKQLESFVSAATRGSLTAAAKAEGVGARRCLGRADGRTWASSCWFGRRAASLAHEGSAFLEDCQRLLAELASAEASVSAGGVRASGYLRITSPGPVSGRAATRPAGAEVPRAGHGDVTHFVEPERPVARLCRPKASTARCGRGAARLLAGERAAGRGTAACAWPRRPIWQATARQYIPANS